MEEELEILRKVDHPNIIKFHESYIDYRYIHCITNTDNKLKTYFLHETDATDFLSYDYLQVSLLRVAVDSPEHDIAVANTYKTRNGLRTI